MSRDLFVCDCSCTEHQFIIQSFDDNEDLVDDRYVYLSIHLTKSRTIYERLWISLKYIFGHQCRYGAFDEILLSPKETIRLSKVLKTHADRLLSDQPVEPEIITGINNVELYEQNG